MFSAIRQRKKLPVLTGGTGLYLEAVLCAYDMPEAPINEEIRLELSEKSIEELQDLLCRLKPQLHNRTDLDVKTICSGLSKLKKRGFAIIRI